jgi:hypothetical protein
MLLPLWSRQLSASLDPRYTSGFMNTEVNKWGVIGAVIRSRYQDFYRVLTSSPEIN